MAKILFIVNALPLPHPPHVCGRGDKAVRQAGRGRQGQAGSGCVCIICILRSASNKRKQNRDACRRHFKCSILSGCAAKCTLEGAQAG